MAFPDFLKKKKKDKKGKAFEPQLVIHKCLKVLEQIKQLNEEKYSKLYRSYMNDFDNVTNIQKKKIQGFYAQLVEELKSLQGTAQERLYATGQDLMKKAEKTAKTNPAAKKAVKEVSKVVDKVTKAPAKRKKKAAKKKAPAAKKKTAKTAKKKTAKKKTSKK